MKAMFAKLFARRAAALKLLAVAFLSYAALDYSAVAAHATGPTAPTIDYTAGLQSVLDTVGSVIGVAWPYVGILLAVFIGLRLVMNLPRRAAK